MNERQWGTIPILAEIGEVSTDGWFKYYNWRNTGKEKLTRGGKDGSGHLHVCMTINGERKTFLIHRLMALIFIPIPKLYDGIPIEKLEVHHNNFDPIDNRLDNLRWLTHAEHRALHGSKSVVQLTKDDVFVEIYASAKEAGEKIGKKSGNTHIGNCCNGKRTVAYGSKWMWYKDWLKINPNKSNVN